MCFSAEVSFMAAAALLPAGGLALRRALRTRRSYAPLAALPLLFGLQQLAEGLVWVSGESDDRRWVEIFSIGYMFFSWLAWPVWVPFAPAHSEP